MVAQPTQIGGSAAPSMRLRVVQLLGQPSPREIAATFVAPGGTIGRSLDNTLPLPDPLRQISRSHARLDYTDDGWTIVCTSQSLSMTINGVELFHGQPYQLGNADHIVIGGFELVAELEPALSARPAARTDVFAAELPQVFAEAPPEVFPRVQPEVFPRVPPDVFQPAPPEIFSAAPAEIFAAAPPEVVRAAQPDIAAAAPPFDVPAIQPGDPPDALSNLMSAAHLDAGPAEPLGDTPGSLTAPAAPADILDAMFGLSGARDLLAKDSPLPALSGRPSASVGAAPAPQAGVVLSWDLPQPQPTRPISTNGSPAASPPPASQTSPASAAPIAPRTPAAPREPAAPWATAAPLAPFLTPFSVAAPTPSTAEQPPSPSSLPTGATSIPPDACALLLSLLQGAGLTELPRRADRPDGPGTPLTPELMLRIGQLLRVVTEGTLQLIQARATIKREMRTEVTTISARQNNPLKFSPDAASALAHLLRPDSVRGFLEPVAAMHDVFDDLMAHQVGFVAGMRAAVTGVVERFDPEYIESEMTRKPVLAVSRKARLWDLFNERFAALSREAQDDFESFFGREFVKAYEAQIDLMQRAEETGSAGADRADR